MKKVLVFGTFDIIHPGHFHVLNEARKLGEVYVCLGRDETIEKLKGRPPYYKLEERQKHLEELAVTVLPGSLGDKYQVFRDLNPDIVLLGYDQEAFVEGLHDVIARESLSTEVRRVEPFQSEFFKSSKLREIIEDPESGFLLIDKPVGEPSFKTVVILRKKTNQKKIGFAGTLDPMASGLLVVGINRATKLLDSWHLLPKEYEAEITLGSVSDTFDADGQISFVSDRFVDLQEIEDLMPQFTGVIEQRPPAHSAKKIGGQKAYDLARQGQEVCIRKQTIEIFELEIVDYKYPKIHIRVRCSSGTYIRSLADDIGKELGVGAHLTALRRTAIGTFSVTDAVSVDELTDWHQQLLPTEKIIKRFII